MPKVPDHLFPLPSEINALPCFSASRLLKRVPEEVEVVSVCQDPNNPALVEITFTLNGVFEFQPFCKILSVDGDTSFGENDVRAPFAIGHKNNPSLPITTNCSLLTDTVVFDFGAVIPAFLSAREIVFELGMVGTLPQAFGVQFQPSTPTFQYTWTKGALPSPVGISLINGQLAVVFDYRGELDCTCNIECIQPSGVSQELLFCPNQRQEIIIDHGPMTGSPIDILIRLEDSLGNDSSINLQALINVLPRKPVVVHHEQPKHNQVSVLRISNDGKELHGVEYRIYRYEGTDKNVRLWKDWSDKTPGFFVDYDVIPGKEYGYSVMYRGAYKDMTRMSDWATIQIP